MISSVKGVFDILPSLQGEGLEWRQSHLWQYVESVMRQVATSYNFFEVRTPLFEKLELFARGVGENTDIVSKEMYTFEDRGGRLLALRPEGTASVMRAFIEKHLDQNPGLKKYFYFGPMFRYERPQAGRYRQHHQFGVEAIGSNHPLQDVEVIDLLCTLYRQLGLKELTIQLNSIGDEESRTAYKEALRTYLAPHVQELSKESQLRFERNILRILDSKDVGDQKILQKAPKITSFLTSSAKDRFEEIKKHLTNLNHRFVINPFLVRGLDYYNQTVFEVTAGELGAQNALGGGGRFDGLIHSLGGPSLPAIGFAAGIERILQTMLGQNVYFPPPPRPLIALIPLGDQAKELCATWLFSLRRESLSAELEMEGKKVKAALQWATQINARFVAIVGEEELTRKKLKLKEMDEREERELAFDELLPFLRGSSDVRDF